MQTIENNLEEKETLFVEAKTLMEELKEQTGESKKELDKTNADTKLDDHSKSNISNSIR